MNGPFSAPRRGGRNSSLRPLVCRYRLGIFVFVSLFLGVLILSQSVQLQAMMAHRRRAGGIEALGVREEAEFDRPARKRSALDALRILDGQGLPVDDVVGTKNADTRNPLSQKQTQAAQHVGTVSTTALSPLNASEDLEKSTIDRLSEYAYRGEATFRLDMFQTPMPLAACPIPVLHPEKFKNRGWGWGEPLKPAERQSCAEKQWGKKARNSGLQYSGRFSELVEKEDESIEVHFVKKDSACYGNDRGVVWEFDEMKDFEFRRMTSVEDAEDRQNFLKERFSMEMFDNADRSGGNNNPFAHPPFVQRVSRANMEGIVVGVRSPYVIARCDGMSEIHIQAPRIDVESRAAKDRRRRTLRDQRRRQNQDIILEGGEHPPNKKALEEANPHDGSGHEHAAAAADTLAAHGLRNILHIMFDSTSLYAQRRASKKITKLLERLNNDPFGSSLVFPFLHQHAVSCCSPGNQIPMYSGNMNGEGTPFVRAEPHQNSKDWIWNIAAENGFRTFWGIDNCPDKSARDFHAFPSVDSRVVAPVCLAGPLLSKTALGCVADKNVDEIVLDGLASFWAQHQHERKFAMAHFITPHESTEKLLIELDELVNTFLEQFEANGILQHTAVILWSDHGINFGAYASTPDGEIEKLFPFANVILPRSFAEKSGMIPYLRHNMHRLSTPYDMYELTRRLLYYPDKPPRFSHDPSNPKLPTPQESHIMASFQKPITPIDVTRRFIEDDRDCLAANIPVEFCTCLPWKELSVGSSQDLERKRGSALVPLSEERALLDQIGGNAESYGRRAIEEHVKIIEPYSGKCHVLALERILSFEVQQWPIEYRPKEKETAKRMWFKPNRDMVRVTYETRASPDARLRQRNSGKGTFVAVFSVHQKNPQDVELVRIDRLDAMGSIRCGVSDKLAEHMCICV